LGGGSVGVKRRPRSSVLQLLENTLTYILVRLIESDVH
jgi:hypothetical protein